MKIFRTVCPRKCYDACAMLAHVEDGRLVKVEGDPDSRVTRGALCPRADRYVERTYHPDRLLQPMRRVGEAGSDEFEPISWDEAIEWMADSLTRTARESDPRALLYYACTGHDGVMTQFGNLFLSHYGGYSSVYGDLCWPAGMEATRLMFGTLHHTPPESYAHSKLIVLWGKNAAVTSPHQMRFVKEAQAEGTQLVCVDPVRTKTARLADEHLAPTPGTDGFLANALAHVILSEDLHDAEFVREHVHGFEDYRRMVRQYEPSKAAEVCGLPKDTIVKFARRLAAQKPANLNAGFGVQRYRNGGQTIRSLAALQVICGNIGNVGGGFDYTNEAAFLARPYPFKVPAQPRVRQLGPVSQLGRVLLGAKSPRIRAAIIERANPMTQNPFSSTVHYALTRLDFVCVIDQFLTDTARRANLVLPAKTMFEETDVHPGQWHGILQIKEKCIEPPGGVRTEREIYRALAEAMGYPTDQFDLDAEAVLHEVLPAGLSVKRLRKESFDRHGPDHVPFADFRFRTPSGKIELLSKAAEISWHCDPLPFYAPPKESAQADPERFKLFPLHLLTPKSEYRQNSQWGNDPHLNQAEEEHAIRMHPDDCVARGLEDGQEVRVYNDRGAIKMPVRRDEGVRPGVAVVYSGKWLSRDGMSVNVLTSDHVTDMGYGATFFDCLVEVEALKSGTE